MTTTDFERLKSLEAHATPAPWKADTETRGDCVLWGTNGQFVANAQAEPHWLPAAYGGKRAVMFDVDRRDVALIEAMRNALPALLDELAKTRAELDEAKTLLHTIWHGIVNAPARELWLRLIREVNPATTAEPAACGDSGLHPGWTCDLPAGHPERQHRQRVPGGVNTWEHPATTAEPANEPKAKRRCVAKGCDGTPPKFDLACDRHPACPECGGRYMHDLSCKTARARRLAGVPAIPDAEPAAG